MTIVIMFSRALVAWAVFVGGVMFVCVPPDTKYMRVGPNDSMRFAGIIPINTWLRYGIFVAFTIVNCVLRTVADEIVKPWIINTVQNTENTDATGNARKYAYEVALYEVMYSWYDYLMLLMIAFVQVDLLLVEITCHSCICMCTTHYYISKKPHSSGDYRIVEMK